LKHIKLFVVNWLLPHLKAFAKKKQRGLMGKEERKEPGALENTPSHM
jgi:hypothetical protein